MSTTTRVARLAAVASRFAGESIPEWAQVWVETDIINTRSRRSLCLRPIAEALMALEQESREAAAIDAARICEARARQRRQTIGRSDSISDEAEHCATEIRAALMGGKK